MRRKFFKIFSVFFIIVSATVITGIGAFLWRVKCGPVSLNRFLPVVSQKAAKAADGLVLTIGDASLVWNQWTSPVSLELSDVHIAFKDAVRLDISRVNAVFRLFSLLRGRVAPRRLLIVDPVAHLVVNETEENGNEGAPETTDGNPLASEIVRAIERHDGPNRFQIRNARIKISDAAKKTDFDIPSFSFVYARHFGRYKLNAEIAVQMADKPVRTRLSARWLSHAAFLPLSVAVDEIDLKKLPGAEKYPFLKGVSVPLKFDAAVRVNLRPLRIPKADFKWHDAVGGISFSLTGKEGDIVLPADIGGAYDVKSLRIDGEWNGRGTPLSFPVLSVAFRNGGELDGSFTLKNIAKAVAKKDPAPLDGVLHAHGRNIAVAQVRDYWPRSSIPSVYDWVVGHVSAGVVPEAEVLMTFGDDGTGFGITSLDVSHGIKDVTLTYMDGMPEVTDGNGRIAYSLSDIVINVDSARSAGLSTHDGRVSFVGLDKPVTTFELSVPLEVADLSDAMKIVLSPGLGLTKKTTQVGPENLSGPAAGFLALSFPLSDKDLEPEDVSFTVTAKTDNAAFTGYPFDFISLTGLNADLTVSEKGLTLTAAGSAQGGDVRAELFQDFTGKENVSTDLTVTGLVTDGARRRIGVGFAAPPYLNGEIPARFLLRLFKDGTGEASAEADLTPAGVAMTPVNWTKKEGIEGKAGLKMVFANGALKSIPDISVSDHAGTRIASNITFTPDGGIDRIEVPVLIAGKTDMAARVRFNVKGKTRIEANGRSLDLSLLMKKEEKDGEKKPAEEKAVEKAPAPERPAEKTDEDKPPYVVNAVFDKIWLTDSAAAENNAFSAFFADGALQRIDAAGVIGEEKTPFRFKFYPDPGTNESAFALSSKNAGNLLKLMGSVSDVKGGELKMKGTYNEKDGVRGFLEIDDFRLKEQPILTRLLRLTSFTGIIDTLTGKGLLFETAEAQFGYKDGRLAVTNGLVTGSSLGITLEGEYKVENGYLNLTGTLMPFYGVNGLVGKVPLVGKMLTGEKGGGLIGVSYKVQGALPSPEISVNPLSAVAPGIFRKLVPEIF